MKKGTPKKINGEFSFLNNGNSISVEIGDGEAGITFCSFEISAEILLKALSNHSNIKVPMEIRGLDKIGKFHVHKRFAFEIPNKLGWGEEKDAAAKIAKEKCPAGWHPDLYFSSQDSFWNEGDKRFAQCTIRTYVDTKEEKQRIENEEHEKRVKKVKKK